MGFSYKEELVTSIIEKLNISALSSRWTGRFKNDVFTSTDKKCYLIIDALGGEYLIKNLNNNKKVFIEYLREDAVEIEDYCNYVREKLEDVK